VEFVAGFYFFDVELGVEGFGETGGFAAVALTVGVEVIEEAEERVEGGRAGVVVAGDEGSWEGERHFGCVGERCFGDCWKN